jgi:hypothetical protein
MKYNVEFMRNITGADYKEFIDYVYARSDVFGFVVRTDMDQNKSVKDFLDQNKDLITAKKMSHEWAGTITFGEKHEVYFFKTNEESRKVLDAVDSIYSWRNPDLPEDLFFYRDGKIYFYSTSHEEISGLVIMNEEELEEFANNFTMHFHVYSR